MKNAAKYVLAVILATLIFYGGAGVNLMSYCCGDCRSAGVEVVLTDKCCEIHHQSHDAEEDHQHHHTSVMHTDCTEHFCETDCCGMERISFEWDHHNDPVQKMEPVVMDLIAWALPVSSLLAELELATLNTVEQYSPPLSVCPRVYLSLLTTLLI